MLTYEPITLEKAPEYNQLYRQCEEKSADSTFLSLWAWQDTYHFEWAFDSDLCWVRQNYKDNKLYNAPVGQWENRDWAKLMARDLPPKAEMERIPSVLALKLHLACGTKIKLKEQPQHWEYLYELKQLVDLPGVKFHTKRQLANHFEKFYDYRFEAISPQIIPQIQEFQHKWMLTRGDEGGTHAQEENTAIQRILKDWSKLPGNLIGGVIFVEDKIAAYAIGESVDKNELMIHFEKASEDYKGADQAINRMFLEHHCSFKFVNLEQDMGIPELRRARQEYYPCDFVKKYHIYKVD